LQTLGDYGAAIAILTRHIRETEKPAPKAWLMLFDLFAKTERQDQYENLAKGFRILFNAEIPSWSSQKTEASKTLEEYPQVMEKAQRLWGLPSCKSFLDSLLVDDRGGARKGFMLPAYTDILFLLDIIDVEELMAREGREQRDIMMKIHPQAQ